MSFTTKKYTRPVLLTEVRKLSTANFVSYNEFVNALSPRAGARSAKLAALKNLVSNVRLSEVLYYNKGRNAKRELIALIKNS